MFDGIDLKNLNIGDMLNQFQDMAKNAQNQNASNIFTAKAGGGMVEISINGNSEVIDLKIDDSLLEDKDSLQIFSRIHEVVFFNKVRKYYKSQNRSNLFTKYSNFFSYFG